MFRNKVTLTPEEMSYGTTIANLIGNGTKEAGEAVKVILELVPNVIHQKYLCKKVAYRLAEVSKESPINYDALYGLVNKDIIPDQIKEEYNGYLSLNVKDFKSVDVAPLLGEETIVFDPIFGL